MPYEILLHPNADEEYQEAYLWYEEQQENLGERFLTAVRKKLESIALHPETYGRKSNEVYREASVDKFPFVIVFKVYRETKVVFVSAIHHAKKHPFNKYRS